MSDEYGYMPPDALPLAPPRVGEPPKPATVQEERLLRRVITTRLEQTNSSSARADLEAYAAKCKFSEKRKALTALLMDDARILKAAHDLTTAERVHEERLSETKAPQIVINIGPVPTARVIDVAATPAPTNGHLGNGHTNGSAP